MLTDAGRVYAEYCRSILGLMREAQAAVRRADTGRLRTGVVATAGEYVLLRPLAAFRDRYPDIEVGLSIHPRDVLFVELQHHESDLVIAGRPPREAGLVVRARRPSRLVVVGSPGRCPDPLRATWLLRGQGSGTRATTMALLDRLQIRPPTLTLGTHGAVLAAAREGLGVTLIHGDAVESHVAAGHLEILPVEGTPLDRPWYAVTTRTRPRRRDCSSTICCITPLPATAPSKRYPPRRPPPISRPENYGTPLSGQVFGPYSTGADQ